MDNVIRQSKENHQLPPLVNKHRMMAINESNLVNFLCDDNFVNKIITVQSCLRRWLVKKKMAETILQFKCIVKDIEGPGNEAVWPKLSLSYPVVRKVNASSTIKNDVKTVEEQQQKLKIVTYPSGSLMKSSPLESSNPSECCTHTASENRVSEEHSHTKQTFVSIQVQTEQMEVTDFLTENQTASSNPNYENLNLAPNLLDIPDTVCVLETCDVNSKLSQQPVDVVSAVSHLGLESHESQTVAASGINSLTFPAHPDNKPCDDKGSERGLETKDSLPHQSTVSHQDTKIETLHYLMTQNFDHIMRDIPSNERILLELKKSSAMELLWIQQAIHSRKQYLRLKQAAQ